MWLDRLPQAPTAVLDLKVNELYAGPLHSRRTLRVPRRRGEPQDAAYRRHMKTAVLPHIFNQAGGRVHALIQRIQATNGQYVRVFTIPISVLLGLGVSPADVPVLARRAQAILDARINSRGYALPRSGDQLYMFVDMASAAGSGGPLNLSRTPNPEPSDEGAWDLNDLDDEVILHELLHRVGLNDEYVESEVFFRRNEYAPMVYSHGIMATLDPSRTVAFPERYLARIEDVSANVVIHSLALRHLPGQQQEAGAAPRGLPARGLRQVRMPGTGDCFFYALIEMYRQAAMATGERVPELTVAGVRQSLAAYLRENSWVRSRLRDTALTIQAEHYAARHLLNLNELRARWAREGREPDWSTFAAEIETVGSWENPGGDLAPLLAAAFYRIRIEVIQPNSARSFWLDPVSVPDDQWANLPSITLYRPNRTHWDGTAPASGQNNAGGSTYRWSQGGARGDDPVASGWPVGQPIMVDTAERGSAEDQTRLGSAEPLTVPHIQEVQLGPGPEAIGKGKGKGKGKAADASVYTFTGSYTGQSATTSDPTFSYTVTADGRITLPDGLDLSPNEWVRHGPDFLHTTTGVVDGVLYGDSGWIGRVENADTLSVTLNLAAMRPYRLSADANGLYLTPHDSGPSIVIENAWRSSSHSGGPHCVEVTTLRSNDTH
jgi:hypothetical protein